MFAKPANHCEGSDPASVTILLSQSFFSLLAPFCVCPCGETRAKGGAPVQAHSEACEKRTYPELSRCRLVVRVIETRGCRSAGAADFIRQLVRAVRVVPPRLRTQRTFAHSLLDLPLQL